MTLCYTTSWDLTTCSSSSTLVGWRGHVDVDLIGVSDPPGYTYSNIKNLYCVP